MNPTGKKPWPADAVIIVAAEAGKEIRAAMENVVPATCRDCGQLLNADSRTIRIARDLPSRHGRPVEFFCTDCCLTYDRDDVDELHDHRGGGNKTIVTQHSPRNTEK